MKIKAKFILFSFLALTSCIEYISDYEIESNDPKIVVNAQLNTDSTIQVNITRSLGILESIDTLPAIPKASVSLTIDDNDPVNLTYTSKGYFVLENQYADINSTYTLNVSADGYEPVSSVTHIPETVEILSYDTSSFVNYDYGYEETYFQIQIRFKDSNTDSNYYALSCYLNSYYTECIESEIYYDVYGIGQELCKKLDTIYEYGKESINSYDNSIEFYKAWGDYYLAYEGYSNEGYKLFFSDKYFNGQTKTLTFYLPKDELSNSLEGKIDVYLYSLDKSYYQFYKSLAQQNEIDDISFAEKITIYTNVENGLGLFTSYSLDSITVQADTAMLNN